MTRAEAKARAKEMRKAIEQRGERREYTRHLKEQGGRSSSANADAKESAAEAQASAPPSVAADAGVGADSDATIFDTLPTPPTVELPPELWMTVLKACDDVRSLCVLGATCHALAELASKDSEDLWEALHASVFGGADAAVAATLAGGARRRCVDSEAALGEWREALVGSAAGSAADTAPAELPLPGMTACCLAGEVGVSTHEGRLTRLWEAASGRRLGCTSTRRTTDDR